MEKISYLIPCERSAGPRRQVALDLRPAIVPDRVELYAGVGAGLRDPGGGGLGEPVAAADQHAGPPPLRVAAQGDGRAKRSGAIYKEASP